AGHVHNYQRSKPLKFQPTKVKKPGKDAAEKTEKPGGEKVEKGVIVEGKFTLDEKFDGKDNTQPDGVIYIVTGGGGAKLYDPDFTNQPDKWKVTGAAFTAKFVSDRHSFSLVELDRQKFTLRQIDEAGNEVDRVLITKPVKEAKP
ncbi:MAG: hypothetical protein ACRD82_08500, partial [Blastocatellia bacterium]